MNPDLDALAATTGTSRSSTPPPSPPSWATTASTTSIEDHSVDGRGRARAGLERHRERLEADRHRHRSTPRTGHRPHHGHRDRHPSSSSTWVIELRSDQMDGPTSRRSSRLPRSPPRPPSTPTRCSSGFSKLAGIARPGRRALPRRRGAKGRTPAALCLRRSINSLDGYLARRSTRPVREPQRPRRLGGRGRVA
jgi:hypothetical protein